MIRVQNFLDVDPHFGTREEFRDFVRAAHEQGMYVILDVIAHHTGNVFTLATARAGSVLKTSPRSDGPRPFGSIRSDFCAQVTATPVASVPARWRARERSALAHWRIPPAQVLPQTLFIKSLSLLVPHGTRIALEPSVALVQE